MPQNLNSMRTASSKFRNLFLERQFVRGLIAEPHLIDEFPASLAVLTDPITKSVVSALKKKKTEDIGVLADLMSKNGAPGTTRESLKKDVVMYVDEALGEDKPDIHATYEQLLRMTAQRNGIPMAMETIEEIIAGKVDPVIGLRNLADKAERELMRPDIEGVDTNNWLNAFEENQEKARQRFRDKKFLTFPPEFDMLTMNFPMIEPGIIGIIADSGVGKTKLSQRIAHHWAHDHGRKVVYASSEANAFQMQARYITSVLPHIKLHDLMTGFTSEEIRKALLPYSSGGYVRYIDANDYNLEAILFAAAKAGADIVLDVAHDIGLDYIKSENETTRWKTALQKIDKFCMRNRKCALLTVQATADARRTAKLQKRFLNLDDAFGGSNFKNKISIGLELNYPYLEQSYSFWDPRVEFPKDQLKQVSGKTSQLGVLSIGKARYTPAPPEDAESPYRMCVWNSFRGYKIEGTHPAHKKNLLELLDAMLKGKPHNGA